MESSDIIFGDNFDKRFYGVYRGICVSSSDPIGKRRIKLKVPQILGLSVTDWAWPVTSASLPLSESGVWVMFEGGDPNFPLWMGVF